MNRILEMLLSADKPPPPDPTIYQACEDCGHLTNATSIAWPKETIYRYICDECRRKRKEEQNRMTNISIDDLASSFTRRVLK